MQNNMYLGQLDARLVEVQNLRNNEFGFRKIVDKGDFTFKPLQKKNMPFYEVKQQISDGNKGFIGTDGFGNHCSLLITDPTLRAELFDMEKPMPITYVDREAVEELLKINNQDKFEKRLKELVVTQSEKKAICDYAISLDIDDYPAWKRRAIHNHCMPFWCISDDKVEWIKNNKEVKGNA